MIASLRRAAHTLAYIMGFSACLCSAAVAHEPDPPATTVFSLPAAVDFALAHYPAVRSALEQLAAARAGVGVARTAYLPHLDLLWQENRGTRNNISGVLLPQPVVPAISGPVLDETSWRSVWGSAAGGLLSWEPFDFGLRQANVDLARALTQQASAGLDVTRLDAATTAADAFIAVVAAEQAVRAAQANVDRLHVFVDSVHTLVHQQLRPGADAARADAELAAATNQLIRTQEAVDVNRATLAETLGIAGTPVTVEAGPLLTLPASPPPPAPDFSAHPQALAEAAAVDAIRARERVLDRTYYPHVNLQADVYGRGSGALADGRLEGGTSGLRPDVGNWISGVSVSFPMFDIVQLRARRQVEAHNEAAKQADYEQTRQELHGQYARAQALVDGAQRIAENTPVELSAARQAEAQARARYQAALASITEVAEAQRLLAQAETDDALARLGVWRAQLIAARVRGDLTSFLQALNAAAPAGGP